MVTDLPSHARWILLGDMNMVEQCADKTQQCASLISIRERTIFTAMKTTL
jgi:hypothetical protein